MGLNKAKGNMYEFATHTWNTVKGKCPHDCSYCYMKRFPQADLHFDKDELRYANLTKDNFIFVGSSCDMWAESIPPDWIEKTLNHCCKYNDNTYLFQTKNPKRFLEYRDYFPKNTVLGITLETNRDNKFTGGDVPVNRVFFFTKFSKQDVKLMITCEPIMDFDLDEMLSFIFQVRPNWVNIGADSGGHKLPEPSPEKVRALIDGLQKAGLTVKKKTNLERLLNPK